MPRPQPAARFSQTPALTAVPDSYHKGLKRDNRDIRLASDEPARNRPMISGRDSGSLYFRSTVNRTPKGVDPLELC
jgi:hypothetical protein